MEYGNNGEAEQDMALIWEAVATCIKESTAAAPGTQVVGIGLTGQGDGAWLIDENGQPVRKAAIWLDGRASARAEQWGKDGRAAKVLETMGTTLFGGLVPILLEEFEETEPEVLARARWHVNCKDWVRYNLTGEVLTDYTEASRSYLDVRTLSGFSEELAQAVGQKHMMRLLPRIVAADGDGGKLTAEAAQKVGLPEGTPVGVGMIDVAVTGGGLGAVDDGEGWLILGTTGFAGVLQPSLAQRKSDLSMVLATGRGSQVLEFLVPMTGTPNLDWIRETLGMQASSWAEIEDLAKDAGPGSGGVLYLPYAAPSGERAPFLDADASASWSGMSLTTTRAQILRSVYEGVAFTLVECAQVLEMKADLVVSGGGFQSELMCQILADTTGQRVIRQDAPEAGARGAAVYALVSAGVEPDVHTAARKLATDTSYFEPNADNYEVYRSAYENFLAVRAAIRPTWPAARAARKLTIKEEK